MRLIDANVILRYLLNDNREMAQTAKGIIAEGACAKPEIIAEVVYVLKRVYQVPKEDIRLYIQALLQIVACTEGKAVAYAVNLYAELSLDFVDCLLIAYHRLNKEHIFTFDKKLAKHLDA